MLNFRNTRLIFIIVMTGLVLAGLFYNLPLYVYPIPVVIWVTLLAWGSYFIGSGFYLSVTCSGPADTNEVALTFDDGPDASITPAILDVLSRNGVPAAFFCIGERMANHPELVKRIDEEGHLLGNHSFSHHFLFDLFPRKRMATELMRTRKTGQNILNKRIRFFRPPYGVTTPNLARVIRDSSSFPVGWSLRSYDTRAKDPSVLVKKIGDRVRPGDIILLHDTMKVTADALQGILDAIRGKGLQPVRLDKILNQVPYA